jgi:hypothetical protein
MLKRRIQPVMRIEPAWPQAGAAIAIRAGPKANVSSKTCIAMLAGLSLGSYTLTALLRAASQGAR